MNLGTRERVGPHVLDYPFRSAYDLIQLVLTKLR